MKGIKGKTTHRKSEKNKRRKSALAIADTCQVLELSKEEWKVQLQGNQVVFHIVQLFQSSCTCKLSCCHYGACVDMYSCSCLDSAIHNTACKHSHLVHMKQKELTPDDEELLHILLDYKQHLVQKFILTLTITLKFLSGIHVIQVSS